MPAYDPSRDALYHPEQGDTMFVLVRELADHAPVNYARAVFGQGFSQRPTLLLGRARIDRRAVRPALHDAILALRCVAQLIK